MTLRQLTVFLAVADSGSFSRGAEAVRLAQSTISQHIRALEEELGARLFDRAATQVTLTEAGRLFHGHAERICRQCREAAEAVRRFQGLEQATLRIGGSTIPAACLIPDLLGRFSAGRPGVRLELKQGDTREILSLLRDGQVELAVVGGAPAEEAIDCEEVGTERVVLVAAPGLTPGASIAIAQLTEVPLIQRESGSGTRSAADAALHQAGFDPRALRVVAQLGSSEAVRRAVLGGAGYAFMSTLAVGPELVDGSLREVCVEGLEIRRSFYLAWRRGCSLSPAAELFIRVMKETLPGLASAAKDPLSL